MFRTFRRLYRLLEPHLKKARGGSNRDDPDYVERSPTGPIPLNVRLVCTLRFIVGGKAYTISVMFDISHLSTFESVDIVTNAVNQCGEMEIEFPFSQDEQRKIADGFRLKSPVAVFSCCVGTVDGIVIWTHKPIAEDCDQACVDESKFFVGANTSLA